MLRGEVLQHGQVGHHACQVVLPVVGPHGIHIDQPLVRPSAGGVGSQLLITPAMQASSSPVSRGSPGWRQTRTVVSPACTSAADGTSAVVATR